MDHNPCGINGNEDYPLIYFPNPSNLKNNVCIKTCPDKNSSSVTCLKNALCENGEL